MISAAAYAGAAACWVIGYLMGVQIGPRYDIAPADIANGCMLAHIYVRLIVAELA